MARNKINFTMLCLLADADTMAIHRLLQKMECQCCCVSLNRGGALGACLLQAFHEDPTMAVLLHLQVPPALQGWDALVQQIVDPLVVDLPCQEEMSG